MEQAVYLKPEFLNQYFGANDAAKINFLKLFKVSSSDSLKNLALAIKDKDHENVALNAHNLSSALKYLGIIDLSKVFGMIERECDSSPYDWKSINKRFDEADAIYIDVVKEIDAFLNP